MRRTSSLSSASSSEPLGDDREPNFGTVAVSEFGKASPPPHFDPNDTTSFLRASGSFRHRQFIQYLGVSTPASTPQNNSPLPSCTSLDPDSTSPFDGLLPEGALDSEMPLTASFSASRTAAVELATPSISAIGVASGLQGGERQVLIGDSSGRIAVYDTGKRHRVEGELNVVLSHRAFVPETDCLRSKLIEEKVTRVTPLPPRSPDTITYLASNESTIKLFRARLSHEGGLRRTTMVPTSAFTGKHKRPVHSVSICADQETFLSADDFVVNWWHLGADDTSKATCLVDSSPSNPEDITEIYLSAKFSPAHSSLFVLGSSSGRCDIGDLRDPPSRRPRCFTHRLQLRSTAEASGYDEILLSVADAAFLSNEYVVARDYLTLKLWDLRRPIDPVQTCPVMGCMKPHLEKLYDNDSIFNHFDIGVDQRSSCVVTGMYDGAFAVWYPQRSRESLEYYQIEKNSDSFAAVNRVPPPATPSTNSFSDYTSTRIERVAICDGGTRLSCVYGDTIVVLERNGPNGSGRLSPFSTSHSASPHSPDSNRQQLPLPQKFRFPKRLKA
jgi:hypothetical protein